MRLIWTGALVLTGCLPALENDCDNDQDCPDGVCQVGVCVNRVVRVDSGGDAGGPDMRRAVPDAAPLPDAMTSADAGSPDACAPVAERCNQLDDDCDGEIDESGGPEPIVEACYDGPADTRNVGACAPGERICGVTPAGMCPGEVLPRAEDCNGRDDDCDRQVDEGIPSEACYTGPPDTQGIGTCRTGERICAEGRLQPCAGEVLPTPEICDQADNDCNGVVDDVDGDAARCECEAGDEAPCYGGPGGTAGVGLCEAGSQVCLNGTWGPCEAQTLPRPEVCNGQDEDCDGTTDEGLGGEACVAGMGACAREGQTACVDARMQCGGGPGAPQDEACNRADDDCDGRTDEGLGLGEPCTAGQGRCRVDGETMCGPAGGVVCSAQPQPDRGLMETCNGVDDDCDGAVDEQLDAVPCFSGEGYEPVGACRAGTARCSGGRLGGCMGEVLRAVRQEMACDEVDEDCDGATDEGVCADCPGGVERQCYSGPAGTVGRGICTAGVQRCVGAGEYGPCDGQRLPAEEACNGADDDCDGRTDEGLRGEACAVGQGACAAEGVEACVAGEWACDAPVIAPAAEVCDGQDNDCDGRSDEQAVGVGEACMEAPQCPANGTRACVNGVLVCQTPPAGDVCNGVDDDCDGRLDEAHECADVENGDGGCVQGVCGIARCDAHWFNADGETPNGCEVGCDPFVFDGAFAINGRARVAVADDGAWAVAHGGPQGLRLRVGGQDVVLHRGFGVDAFAVGAMDGGWVVVSRIDEGLTLWLVTPDPQGWMVGRRELPGSAPNPPAIVSLADGSALVVYHALAVAEFLDERTLFGTRVNRQEARTDPLSVRTNWPGAAGPPVAAAAGPAGVHLAAFTQEADGRRWRLLAYQVDGVGGPFPTSEIAQFAGAAGEPRDARMSALGDSLMLTAVNAANSVYWLLDLDALNMVGPAAPIQLATAVAPVALGRHAWFAVQGDPGRCDLAVVGPPVQQATYVQDCAQVDVSRSADRGQVAVLVVRGNGQASVMIGGCQ